MPSHLKELVRARMRKTGETYQQALRHVRAQERRAPSPPSRAEEHAPSERARSIADTAFAIAAVRGEEEARPATERLFADPYAAIFAAAGAESAESAQRFLDLPFFRDGIRLRTRYLDDQVRDALAAGVRQIVLLGAGFDARGLRMPEITASGATVLEVDTGYQLARKRRILAAASVASPPRIRHLAFDLESPDLEEELVDGLEVMGFTPGAATLFVWEGVIGYIDEAAIDRSLRAMARAGGVGTRVAFTFGDEAMLGVEPMAERVRRCGFATLDACSGDALWRRYLPGPPHPNAWAMKVGVASI